LKKNESLLSIFRKNKKAGRIADGFFSVEAPPLGIMIEEHNPILVFLAFNFSQKSQELSPENRENENHFASGV
jgi:hypothetical protein